jgi:hypothetical protein
MAILSYGRFPELLYVDGFAGPGEYSDGEDGSPIIALKAALGHKPPLQAKIHFLFVKTRLALTACVKRSASWNSHPTST